MYLWRGYQGIAGKTFIVDSIFRLIYQQVVRAMVNFSSLLDIAYGGVDFSLPGNGGTECVAFLSLKQRIIETITYELLTAVVLWNVRKRLSVPEELQPSREGSGLGKRLLLVLLCLTFGIEIGFKLATRQVIFLLNPCHVLSALQVRNGRA